MKLYPGNYVSALMSNGVILRGRIINTSGYFVTLCDGQTRYCTPAIMCRVIDPQTVSIDCSNCERNCDADHL